MESPHLWKNIKNQVSIYSNNIRNFGTANLRQTGYYFSLFLPY